MFEDSVGSQGSSHPEGLEQDQSLESVISGWITGDNVLFGGDHGVVWSPRSFSFSDAGIGPSGEYSPKGFCIVQRRIFSFHNHAFLG